MADYAYPIIDSHIHLFAASHLPSLSWAVDLPQDHVLNRGYTVADYEAATRGLANLKGFVFVEVDRISGLDASGWQNSLDEISFIARIAQEQSLPDEGHQMAGSKALHGAVPWAPVAAGPMALAKYVDLAEGAFVPNKRDIIKGFRYLLHDKAPRTMLQLPFIESLQWLGEHNFSFDLGVDARSGGQHQLEEACQMMDILYSEGSDLKIIINHFCKPNLRLSAQEAASDHPDFTSWKGSIGRMASYPNTYMKLSGFFSELPPLDEASPMDISTLVTHIQPWVSAVFAAFTAQRVMFGSDWPVCNIGGPGIGKTWSYWHALVTAILTSLDLTPEEKAMVWSGTAIKAYNIDLTS